MGPSPLCLPVSCTGTGELGAVTSSSGGGEHPNIFSFYPPAVLQSTRKGYRIWRWVSILPTCYHTRMHFIENVTTLGPQRTDMDVFCLGRYVCFGSRPLTINTTWSQFKSDLLRRVSQIWRYVKHTHIISTHTHILFFFIIGITRHHCVLSEASFGEWTTPTGPWLAPDLWPLTYGPCCNRVGLRL